MDPPMKEPVKRQYPLNFPSMRFADDKDDSVIVEPHPIAITNILPTFEGIDIADLEMVLESAPKDVGWIIKDLINKYILDRGMLQSSFFVGNYGTGKTLLAKAIAYKVCSNSDWSYEYISSREFVGQYRNATGVCLRSYLKKIVELKRPIILIIDQLNKILEYTNSSSDDTSFASDLICNFLDMQRFNKNLFLIGVMDRGTKLDERLKDRLVCNYVDIDEPINAELKRIIFTSKIVNENTKLHPEVTHEWLTQFFENAPAITGRNFRCLALHLNEMLKTQKSEEKLMHEDEITLITQSNLQLALESYLAAEKHLFHVDPYENHIDRTERLHKQLLAQRELIHQEQMAQLEQIFQATLAQEAAKNELRDENQGCAIC